MQYLGALSICSEGKLGFPVRRAEKSSKRCRMTTGVLVSFELLLSLCSALLLAQQPPAPPAIVYRTASSVLALSPDVAAKGALVRLQGTVTLSNSAGFVVHDHTGGIWIHFPYGATKYNPGDLVTVVGRVQPGRYSPQLADPSVQLNGHGPLPIAKAVSFEQLSSGLEDAQYVSVEGTILTASVKQRSTLYGRLLLTVAMPDGRLNVILPSRFAESVRKLIGAKVRITGTALVRKNDNGQATGVILALSDDREIYVLQPGPKDLFSAPLVPIASLMRYRSHTDYFHRVRLRGVLTYYDPGKRLVLQDGSQAIEVFTRDSSPFQIGDRIETVGFPALETSDRSGPVLRDAVSRCLGHGAPPAPMPIQFPGVLSSKYRYTLVSIDTRLLRVIKEPAQTIFLLEVGDHFSTAVLRSSVTVPGFLAPGSHIRISGINLLTMEGGLLTYDVLTYDGSVVNSELLIRSLKDISLVTPASWWTQARLFRLIFVLVILTLFFLLLLMYVQIKRWKTETVLQERERLARDIHDTLAQSFAGIGFQLQVIRKAIATSDPNLIQHVETAGNLIHFSHREARRSLTPQAPEDFSHTDLLLSLKVSAQPLLEGGSIQLESISKGTLRQLPRSVNSELFRIGQEAIANAIRHADPAHIAIDMEYGYDFVRLQIVDDGRGFTIRGDLLGFGIRGMRKRASEIHADFSITSSPGAGTTVSVTVPIPAHNPILSPFFAVRDFLTSILERTPDAADKR